MALARPTTDEMVANLALDKCKEDEIATFDDDINRARVARRHYAAERDALLCRLDWNFASTWVTPAADTAESIGVLRTRYPLPPDCLVVREVLGNTDDDVPLGDDEWAVETGRATVGGAEVETKVLVCNEATVTLRYTRLVDSPRLWDPLFLKAFVCLLAAAMAPQLGKSRTEASAMLEEAEQLLVPMAKRGDSKEKAPSKVGGQRLPSWIAARGNFRTRGRWW